MENNVQRKSTSKYSHIQKTEELLADICPITGINHQTIAWFGGLVLKLDITLQKSGQGEQITCNKLDIATKSSHFAEMMSLYIITLNESG